MKLSHIAILLFLSLSPSSTFAEAFAIKVDKQPLRLTNFDVVSDTIKSQMGFNRSYCCSVISERPDTLLEIISVTADFSSTSLFSLGIPAKRGGANENADAGIFAEGSEMCFTSFVNTIGGATSLEGGVTIGVSSSVSPLSFDADCRETTLRGNYNTVASTYNFLEMTSTGGATTVTVQVDPAATAISDPDVSAVIPFGGRVDIALHDIAGPNKFGSVRILHNAKPDNLVAYIAEYKLDPSVPAGFTLVGRTRLTSPN